MVSYTLRPLYAREEARNVEDFRLGVTHSQSESFGEEINTLPLPGFKPHFVKFVSPTQTAVFQFPYILG